MPGKRAFGTTLSYSTTSGGTYTQVANITKLNPWNLKSDHMDTTSHDSAGGYREKVPTLVDSGAVSCDINYDDKAASHNALMANIGVPLFWKIIYPGSTPTTDSFQGFVTGLGPQVPFDNKMTATVSIEITGQVVRT